MAWGFKPVCRERSDGKPITFRKLMENSSKKNQRLQTQSIKVVEVSAPPPPPPSHTCSGHLSASIVFYTWKRQLWKPAAVFISIKWENYLVELSRVQLFTKDRLDSQSNSSRCLHYFPRPLYWKTTIRRSSNMAASY